MKRCAVAVIGLAAALGGCGEPGAGAADAGDGGFARRAMLRALAERFFVPTYERFAQETSALVAALDAHCAALDAGSGATATVDGAQTAWRTAIDTWEHADAVLLGPAAMDERSARDRVYAWPLASTCGVDQDVAARWANPDAYDPGVRFNNVRSLAAIEYLLFVADAAHTCPTAVAGWDAMGADLPRARCGLAAEIAADVNAQAESLWAAWDPSDGDYGSELTEAGTSASSIGSEREAINRLSDALFYVDQMVKDMKLAEAAGIADNACGAVQTPCELEIEHRHADHATAAIRINLAAAREVFTGTVGDLDGLGFEDYLRSVGASDLADRMIAELDAAIAAGDALPESFLEALSQHRDQVVDLHAALKLFTDDLKTQFLTVLGLDIPDAAAGDND
jgi:predicted lipoprotein